MTVDLTGDEIGLMKFDIKDIKSWANRHDVKVGDKGYVSSNLHSLQEDLKNNVALIREISHICDDVYCFSCKAFGNIRSYGLFLPLDAIKKDKSKKKYRSFKSMRELTEIVYSKDWEYDNLSVGDSLWIRRKGDKHIHQNLLITSLGYDENDLISMNEKSMQEWLDEFEFLSHREWKPFGVQIND